IADESLVVDPEVAIAGCDRTRRAGPAEPGGCRDEHDREAAPRNPLHDPGTLLPRQVFVDLKAVVAWLRHVALGKESSATMLQLRGGVALYLWAKRFNFIPG